VVPNPLVEIIRDATSGRKRPWLLVLIGFFLVCSAWKYKLGAPRPPTRPPDTIEYHYGQWLRHLHVLHRGGPAGRFTLEGFIDRFEEKISTSDRFDKVQEHEVALFRLGYFAEYRFETKGRDPKKIIMQFYTNAMRTDLRYNWNVSTVFTHDQTNVCIVARTEDIPKITEIFHQMDNPATNR
jgi:hypothetical protein